MKCESFPMSAVKCISYKLEYLCSCPSVWWVGGCVCQWAVCLYLMMFILFSLVIAGLFERPRLQSLETLRSGEWTETHYQSHSEEEEMFVFVLADCLFTIMGCSADLWILCEQHSMGGVCQLCLNLLDPKDAGVMSLAQLDTDTSSKWTCEA